MSLTQSDATIMQHPLAISAALTFAIRAVMLGLWHPTLMWDGAIYGALAQNLATGLGYTHWEVSTRPTAFYPVGYPALVSVAIRVGFSPTVAAPLVNLFAAVITAMLVALAAKKLAGNRAALLAGAVYAILPGTLLWSLTPMTETLTGTLMTALLCVSLTPRPDGSGYLQHGVYGAITALATLVRPQSILLAPLAAISAPTSHFRWRFARWIAIMASVSAALLCLVPWTTRNCWALDHCALVSTNGGSNLYIGTLDHPTGGFVALETLSDCGAVAGEVARDRCYSRTALQRMSSSPVRWAAKIPKKIFRTFAIQWAPASYWRTAMHGSPTFGWQVLGAVCTLSWWGLIVAAVFGARLLRRGPSKISSTIALRFVALSVAIVAVTHGVFISDDRYQLPVVPLLCVLLAGFATKEKLP